MQYTCNIYVYTHYKHDTNMTYKYDIIQYHRSLFLFPTSVYPGNIQRPWSQAEAAEAASQLLASRDPWFSARIRGIRVIYIYIYAIPPPKDRPMCALDACKMHYGPVSATFGHVLLTFTGSRY